MALSRRRFVRQLAVASVVLAAANVRAAAPSSSGSGGSAKYNLQKQLETGLKARRDSDFRYIANIVAKVENGTLPRRIVDQAFLYSRAKNPQYPLIYFQFSIKELSKKAGVTL
jgi:hypothetical protein